MRVALMAGGVTAEGSRAQDELGAFLATVAADANSFDDKLATRKARLAARAASSNA
ncbi:hypothetical protein ACWEOE_37265 [Amycolatopsis sp. NPDC004368]